MPTIKKSLARKAVRSTAKHTAHGTASKFKRGPFRTTTLLGLGGLTGIAIGWIAARVSTPARTSPQASA